jgi:hypothetical protein
MSSQNKNVSVTVRYFICLKRETLFFISLYQGNFEGLLIELIIFLPDVIFRYVPPNAKSEFKEFQLGKEFHYVVVLT